MRYLRLLCVVGLLAASSFGQAWSNFLNYTSGTGTAGQVQLGIDWTQAGIVGGIPVRSTIFCTFYNASGAPSSGTGSNGDYYFRTDVGHASAMYKKASGSWSTTGNEFAADLQTALNAAPTDNVVFLKAGTFYVSTNLTVPSHVVLRGSGADQTILSTHGTSGAVIQAGSGDPPSALANSVDISSGSTAQSQSIVVTSGTNFAVNGYALISELNDPAYVSPIGGDGTSASYVDAYWNGSRVRGQIVKVTSVAGTTIGFDTPLYSNYGAPAQTAYAGGTTYTAGMIVSSGGNCYVFINSTPSSGHAPPNGTYWTQESCNPQALPFPSSEEYAGVENLQIYSNNTGYNEGVLLERCNYCWVKGVEFNYVDGNGDYIVTQWCYHVEFRDNYFSSAYNHTSGSTENQIALEYKTTASKVENNICERTQTCEQTSFGSSGNVVAYNFSVSSVSQDDQTLLVGLIGYLHNPHSQFNLFEGNVAPYFNPDSVWGTHSANTFFRNWSKGTARACLPLTGRSAVNCTGANGVWATTADRAIDIGPLDPYMNFIGNVIGSAEMSALSGSLTLTSNIQWPTTRSYTGVAYGTSFGFATTGDTGTAPLDSTNAFTNTFLHGNYNNISAAVTWNGSYTHTLPASFYLSGKPTWWPATIVYPAIGPDVSGSGPGGFTSSTTTANPAMNCFFNFMGGTEGSAGSPYSFNANTCYASSNAPTTINGAFKSQGTWN